MGWVGFNPRFSDGSNPSLVWMKKYQEVGSNPILCLVEEIEKRDGGPCSRRWLLHLLPPAGPICQWHRSSFFLLRPSSSSSVHHRSRAALLPRCPALLRRPPPPSSATRRRRTARLSSSPDPRATELVWRRPALLWRPTPPSSAACPRWTGDRARPAPPMRRSPVSAAPHPPSPVIAVSVIGRREKWVRCRRFAPSVVFRGISRTRILEEYSFAEPIQPTSIASKQPWGWVQPNPARSNPQPNTR